MCAVACKLARLAWALHKHGTRYDPLYLHLEYAGKGVNTQW
jgi:hypothetical protein